MLTTISIDHEERTVLRSALQERQENNESFLRLAKSGYLRLDIDKLEEEHRICTYLLSLLS